MKPITQTNAKRVIAAALAARKAANGWSNTDIADLTRQGEGTIRNRLDGDNPNDQMRVIELLLLIQADGADMANVILRDLVGYELVKVQA